MCKEYKCPQCETVSIFRNDCEIDRSVGDKEINITYKVECPVCISRVIVTYTYELARIKCTSHAAAGDMDIEPLVYKDSKLMPRVNWAEPKIVYD